MKSTTLALSAAAILRGVHGHAFFLQLNDQKQGIPQPSNNNPLLDVKSKDIACNAVQRGGDKTLIPLQAGSTATLTWRHTAQSGPDDVIDASHHGPVTAWMKKVDDAASDPGAGDGWFKIAEDGFANGAWGVDRLIQKQGVQSVTIPSCLPDGQYLLRGEIIALHEAQTAGKAQFYAECAQVQLGGGGGGGGGGGAKGGNSTGSTAGMGAGNGSSVTGATGSTGSTGLTGSMGSSGSTGSTGSMGAMGAMGGSASGPKPSSSSSGVPMSSGSANSGSTGGGYMNGGSNPGSMPSGKNGTSGSASSINGSSGGSTTSSSSCNGNGSEHHDEQNGGSSSSTSVNCGNGGSPASGSGSSLPPQGPMNNGAANNGISGSAAKGPSHFFGGMFPRANMPQTVSLPGAYDPNDPGIKVDIYSGVQSYKAPGPPVFQC